MQEKWVRSLSQEDPLEKEPATHSRKSHGQRSLAGYILWGCRVRNDLVTTPPPQYHVLLFVFYLGAGYMGVSNVQKLTQLGI